MLAVAARRVRCDAALALAGLRDEQGQPAGGAALLAAPVMHCAGVTCAGASACACITPPRKPPLRHTLTCSKPVNPHFHTPQACPRCSTFTASTTSCPPPTGPTARPAPSPSPTPLNILWRRRWSRQVGAPAGVRAPWFREAPRMLGAWLPAARLRVPFVMVVPQPSCRCLPLPSPRSVAVPGAHGGHARRRPALPDNLPQ